MPWFKVRALADKRAVINIYEQIGKNWWDNSGVDAKSFSDTLAALGDLDHIELHINSPGGNVYDGLAIYNLLKRHKAEVTGYVDGIAASIASVILMAADTVIMPENATLFLHDPLTWAQGDADDFRRIADDLDSIMGGLISTYRDKTGLPEADIRELMRGDTLMTAAEAVAKGFADQLEGPVQAVATLDVAKLRADASAQLKLVAKKPEPKTDPVTPTLTVDNVLAFLDSNQEARAAVTAKMSPPPAPADAAAVIDLCEQHKVTAFAAPLIKAKLPLEQVQGRVTLIRDICDLLDTAKVDKGDILDHLDDPMQMLRITVTNTLASVDPNINPNNPGRTGDPQARMPDLNKIYAARR